MEKPKDSDRDPEIVYMRTERIRSKLNELYPRDFLHYVKESPRIILFQGDLKNNFDAFQQNSMTYPRVFLPKQRINILAKTFEVAEKEMEAAFSDKLNSIFIDTDKIKTKSQLDHALIEESTHSLVKLRFPQVKITHTMLSNILNSNSSIEFTSSEINYFLKNVNLNVILDEFFHFLAKNTY